MKKTYFVVGVFIILSAALSLFFVKVEVLGIYTNQELSRIFELEEGEGFTISWTHSVEKETWEEMFVIEDRSIKLTATRFKTFGAGVPNDTGEETFLKDGWVYMTGISQRIGKQLAIRTGKSTNHTVMYGKDTILSLESQKAYQIKVQKVPLGQYIAIHWRGEEK
ncbi:DUF1850 domain-containing protein [Halobacillus sp. Nhm2S1]|uniref:DUF1850 domain-containing protein n=1 Tax=Halobacillus sp. Nhm2S1 TaxID=2866716 RepID=UPI001C737802|nr:DUF1850 domain-containing protein [Halobacillus sp. Nhm2S1]MBX0357600.1 DUF1850 domain-containing protein [Halobacillus sp. Nhm2S1]